MRLIWFAIYLGTGAMLHAMVLGPTFDWTSAWTFGWLFGWPLMLFVTFGATMIGISIAGGLIWALWTWLDVIAKWRAARRRKERMHSR